VLLRLDPACVCVCVREREKRRIKIYIYRERERIREKGVHARVNISDEVFDKNKYPFLKESNGSFL